MIFSFPVYPLAKRTALIQASVPLLTNLILSIFGTMEIASRANSVSISVGIPKEVPLLAFSITALITGSWACPKINGPQDAI